MKKIKVQFDYKLSNKVHSLYNSFFSSPPFGVEYSITQINPHLRKGINKLSKVKGFF